MYIFEEKFFIFLGDFVDLIPIPSEEYESRFSSPGETSDKVLSSSFQRPFYPRK